MQWCLIAAGRSGKGSGEGTAVHLFRYKVGIDSPLQGKMGVNASVVYVNGGKLYVKGRRAPSISRR